MDPYLMSSQGWRQRQKHRRNARHIGNLRASVQVVKVAVLHRPIGLAEFEVMLAHAPGDAIFKLVAPLVGYELGAQERSERAEPIGEGAKGCSWSAMAVVP